MVSKKVSMPHLDKQPNASSTEGLNKLQNYQQSRSRGQGRMPNIDNHSYPNDTRSLHPEFVRETTKVTARPEDLLPRQHVRAKSTRRTSSQVAKKHRGKRQHRKNSFVLNAMRLVILGVGISAIAGTVLSALNPISRVSSKNVEINTMQVTPPKQAIAAVVPVANLKLNQEIMPLKALVQKLAAKNTKLLPGVFFVDLDTGAYLDLNGDLTFSAASMIKFPILVAFLQDVDAKKIRLDEKLTLKKELIGGGSGEMQYRTPGTKFTALETATKMIITSDNTATNMVIERLGGVAVLNQRFQNWGLTATQLRNPLPDLSGTNITTPKDLVNLMAAVQQGDLLSMKSRDRLLDIMRRTKTKTLLPRGLGAGATIAHKTGDIGSLVGDVGLVDLPNGKRYAAVAMVKRPHNNSEAKELIRQISRAAYQQFNQSTANEVTSTTPFVTNTFVGSREQGAGSRED